MSTFKIKGVFSFHIFTKYFGFWSIILQNRTKHHAKLWKKDSYSPFWILALRGQKTPKMSLKRLHENNKFCIFNGIKYDPENFGILHFIAPK